MMKKYGIGIALYNGLELCTFAFIIALLYVLLRYLASTLDQQDLVIEQMLESVDNI